MTDFNYKKYSLENLENWLHDAMSSAEATPQEIYDVIKGVVEENYYIYKQKTSEAYELLGLLNSGIDNNKYQNHLDKILSCDKDDPSPECKGAWDDFWEDVDEKHSREYNLREAEYYNKRVELDALSEKIKAEGGYEWTPIPSKDVPYPLYMNKEGEICSPDIDFKKDKVTKWRLPVQQSGEDYYVEFPDDLLEAANLKEGDQVEWVEQGDGAYLLRKV